MNISFPEHISGLFSNCTYNISRGLAVPFGYMYFDLLLVQHYDIFSRLDTHFVPGADLENYWADYSHTAHT